MEKVVTVLQGVIRQQADMTTVDQTAAAVQTVVTILVIITLMEVITLAEAQIMTNIS